MPSCAGLSAANPKQEVGVGPPQQQRSTSSANGPHRGRCCRILAQPYQAAGVRPRPRSKVDGSRFASTGSGATVTRCGRNQQTGRDNPVRQLKWGDGLTHDPNLHYGIAAAAQESSHPKRCHLRQADDDQGRSASTTSRVHLGTPADQISPTSALQKLARTGAGLAA